MPKFFCSAKLFEKYPKAKHHRYSSDSYRVNGFLSEDGEAVAVNRFIVEKQPGYTELVSLISQFPHLKDPDDKVRAHLRNLRYNASEDIAPQWGVTDILRVHRYDELPSCLVMTVKDEEISLMNNETRQASALIKKAEKIRSPLLEKLSELAKDKGFS